MQGLYGRSTATSVHTFLTLLVFLLSLSAPSQAHEITPTILNAEITSSQKLTLRFDLNLEALMVGVGSEHQDTDDSPLANQYDRLRGLPASSVEQEAQSFATALAEQFQFTDQQNNPLELSLTVAQLQVIENSDLSLPRESLISYTANFEQPLQSLRISWPEGLGDLIFRVSRDDEIKAALWVEAGASSDPVILDSEEPQSQSLTDYLWIGFEHILPLGVDHILFVIGIYLLNQAWRPLLWQISAFTLAHTLTLALASLGILELSASIVEPLIALSIVYVAVENLFHHNLSRWRVLLVFGFGLLHGLGFAGVLAEIGLSSDQFILSLIAFNLGVELGQLAVITLMFLLLGFWFGQSRYWERWVRIPLSLIIAVTGAVWFIQRL